MGNKQQSILWSFDESIYKGSWVEYNEPRSGPKYGRVIKVQKIVSTLGGEVFILTIEWEDALAVSPSSGVQVRKMNGLQIMEMKAKKSLRSFQEDDKLES